MQSSKELQGEIRTPSSVTNTKKQRKTIKWERLETFSRKFDKMGTIKYRNSMDLTEAEDIKKKCQGYTEKPYQKKSS